MTITEILENYVTDTIKHIVDNPEAVEIIIAISTKSVIVQIRVDKTDCESSHGSTEDVGSPRCLSRRLHLGRR